MSQHVTVSESARTPFSLVLSTSSVVDLFHHTLCFYVELILWACPSNSFSKLNVTFDVVFPDLHTCSPCSMSPLTGNDLLLRVYPSGCFHTYNMDCI